MNDQRITTFLYNSSLLGSSNKLSNKMKFNKQLKVCKVLVDTQYFVVNSWIKKSFAQINLQKDAKSLETLEECAKNLQTKDKRITSNIGNREFCIGNYERSKQHLEDYLKTNPDCKRTQVQLAQVEFRLGNLEESEKMVLDHLQSPQVQQNLRIVLQSLMVQIQHQKQNFKLMAEYANSILQQEPEDSFCQIYLADMKMQNNNTRDEAIASLKKLRLKIYKDRSDFSHQTFQDLIGIISKYEPLLKV